MTIISYNSFLLKAAIWQETHPMLDFSNSASSFLCLHPDRGKEEAAYIIPCPSGLIQDTLHTCLPQLWHQILCLCSQPAMPNSAALPFVKARRALDWDVPHPGHSGSASSLLTFPATLAYLATRLCVSSSTSQGTGHHVTEQVTVRPDKCNVLSCQK